VVDWYRVKFADQTKNAILVDGSSVAVQQKIEEIKTKGGDVVYDTLYYSPFGIIADYTELSASKNEAWAYRWLGQDASEVAIALLKLNRGQNMQDYIDASNHFNSPGQNIVYADVKGNIGIRIPGKYLLRQTNEGLFLRDGTKGANAWQNYIPTEQCVQQFNPERGFVSSANQFPVDSTYPYFIAATQYESYRNRRINQVLSTDTSLSIDEVKLLHSDNYNLEAAENLKYWLAALNFSDLSQHEQSVFNKLINWNFFTNPEMEEPAYYNSWRDAILQNAWDEMNSANMTTPTAYRTFKLLKEQPTLQWWDISITNDTEDAQALIRYAFAQAMSEIDMWRDEQGENKLAMNWGNVKATRLTHLTRQLALSEQNIFIGGNHGIVNATSETHGPSWRQVVELDPSGVKAWGIYPGGQSGNPGSLWYTNYTQQWAAGQYFELNLSFNQENAKRIHRTSFKPQAQ
jgi:penicillin amidase